MRLFHKGTVIRVNFTCFFAQKKKVSLSATRDRGRNSIQDYLEDTEEMRILRTLEMEWW